MRSTPTKKGWSENESTVNASQTVSRSTSISSSGMKTSKPFLFSPPNLPAAVEARQASRSGGFSHFKHKNTPESHRGYFLYQVQINYLITLVTTPAPTVLPPSRIAKLRPCSMAIGARSLTVKVTVSPGMTSSLSAGSSTSPVTSVVRK